MPTEQIMVVILSIADITQKLNVENFHIVYITVYKNNNLFSKKKKQTNIHKTKKKKKNAVLR